MKVEQELQWAVTESGCGGVMYSSKFLWINFFTHIPVYPAAMYLVTMSGRMYSAKWIENHFLYELVMKLAIHVLIYQDKKQEYTCDSTIVDEIIYDYLYGRIMAYDFLSVTVL